MTSLATVTSPPATSATSTTTAPASPCPDLVAAAPGATASGAILASFAIPGGEPNWAVRLGDLPAPAPFAAGPGAVFVAAADRVWGLGAADCAVRWEQPGRNVQALTLIDPGTLAVVDPFGVALVDAASGAVRWRRPAPWEAGRPPAAVAAAGEAVLVSTPGGELVAYGADDGVELFRAPVEVGRDLLSAPLASAGSAFVTYGSAVERRSLGEGSVEWEADAGFHVMPGLAVAGGRVFVVSSADASVAALDAATGAEVWRRTVDRQSKFNAPPVVDHGELHLLDWAGRLHHLDLSDGASVLTGEHASDRTVWRAEDRIVIEQHGDAVEGYTLGERRAWRVVTAGGVGRVTDVDASDGHVVTLTYTAG